MVEGSAYVRHSEDGKESVRVFFVEDLERSGCLYWCGPGEHGEQARDPACSLQLQDITDIFLGKTAAVFQGADCAAKPEGLFLSLVGTVRSLHLEGASPDTVAMWMAGLQTCITSGGKKMLPTDAAEGPRGRRMSVSKAAHPRLPRSAEETMTQLSNRRSSLLAVPASTMLSMMKEGREFTLFEMGQEARRVTLYYSEAAQGGPAMDALNWVFAGQPSQLLPDQCLPIAALSTVFLGKQTPSFRGHSAAVAARCFTIGGFSQSNAPVELNLQADLEEILSAWLFGLNSLASRSGKKVVDQFQPAARGRDARRLSVVSTRPGPAAPSAAAPVVQLLPLERIEQGFEAKVYKAGTHGAQAEEVFLWYSKQRSDLGYLYWAPSLSRQTNPDNCLDINDVVEIYVGKQTELFKELQFADLNQEFCFTLMLRNGNELNIELRDESAVVATWIPALAEILTQGGKNVCEEGNDAELTVEEVAELVQLTPQEEKEEHKHKEGEDGLEDTFRNTPVKNQTHQTRSRTQRTPSRKRFSVLARAQKNGMVRTHDDA